MTFDDVFTVMAHYVARYRTQFGVDPGSHTWLHFIMQIILHRSKRGRNPGKTNKFPSRKVGYSASPHTNGSNGLIKKNRVKVVKYRKNRGTS